MSFKEAVPERTDSLKESDNSSVREAFSKISSNSEAASGVEKTAGKTLALFTGSFWCGRIESGFDVVLVSVKIFFCCPDA